MGSGPSEPPIATIRSPRMSRVRSGSIFPEAASKIEASRITSDISVAPNAAAIGDVSRAVTANNNVFIIELAEYFEPDSTAFEDERLLLRDEMVAFAQQSRLQEWLQGLRDVARIIDRRDEVLNTDPADAQQPIGGLGF